MREAGCFVQEEILHHHALHIAQARRDVLRVRIGLRDIFALNINALESAFDRGVDHVGDTQTRLVLQRHAPGFLKQMPKCDSSETWR